MSSNLVLASILQPQAAASGGGSVRRDLLYRYVTEGSAQPASAQLVGETFAIAARISFAFNTLKEESEYRCRVLGRVIDALKHREQYTALYHSFLLGDLSEDEFGQASEAYAYTPRDEDPGKVARDLAILIEYTSCEVSATEAAELMRVKDSVVTSAMEQLALPLAEPNTP